MKKYLLILACFILYVPEIFSAENISVNCGSNISEYPNLEIEYTDLSFSYKWCKTDDQTIKFGDVETLTSNLLFWNDQFFARVYSVVGNDNINRVLRYFKNELEKKWQEKPEAEFFKYPVQRKDKTWVFIEPDRVVRLVRYSVHLSQIEVLCKSMWEKTIEKQLQEKEN